jgi:hypothetical protein
MKEINKLFIEIRLTIYLLEKERAIMVSKKVAYSQRKFVKKLSKKAKKMSNEELRDALWDVRRMSKIAENTSINDLLIKEEIFSKELKNRELLEWALRTGLEK